MFENVSFEMVFRVPSFIKKKWPWHVPNFKELGFNVGPSNIGQNHPFSTMIQDGILHGLKPPILFYFYQSWK